MGEYLHAYSLIKFGYRFFYRRVYPCDPDRRLIQWLELQTMGKIKSLTVSENIFFKDPKGQFSLKLILFGETLQFENSVNYSLGFII